MIAFLFPAASPSVQELRKSLNPMIYKLFSLSISWLTSCLISCTTIIMGFFFQQQCISRKYLSLSLVSSLISIQSHFLTLFSSVKVSLCCSQQLSEDCCCVLVDLYCSILFRTGGIIFILLHHFFVLIVCLCVFCMDDVEKNWTKECWWDKWTEHYGKKWTVLLMGVVTYEKYHNCMWQLYVIQSYIQQ